MEPQPKQVDGDVPFMGVLIKNLQPAPPRSAAGAARKRAAPSPC